jgi:tight adherence protein B
MLIVAIGTFALVAAIVIGSYWVFVVRPEQKRQDVVRKRAGADRIQSRMPRLFKPLERGRRIPVLDYVIDAAGSLVAPLRRLLTQAASSMNVATFILVTAVCAVVAAIAALVVTHLLLVALAAALVAAVLPYQVVKRMRDVRIRKFEEQFPEAIELIGRALRAGHAFPAGLSMVADEMAAPVGPEFRTLYDQQNYGLPLPEALRNFAARIPLLDARFFVTAVLTQRESGGNLAEVLDNLAAVIRERFRVKRQIRVISAHGRITGWVLVALPPSLAVAFMVIGPEQIGKLTGTAMGHMMIYTAIGLQIIGTLIIRRIVRIEY